MEKLKELVLDDEFGMYYDAEIAHRKEINSARSDGYNDGRKEGIKQGKKAGAKEREKSIAKAMLKAGESISKVMNYTGLKKKDIKTLM